MHNFLTVSITLWQVLLLRVVSCYHRDLMTRLSLQVVYLWRHVSSTAPPFILWWSNLEILFGPRHCSSPFIGELRCQAIQMEHGQYIAERTQNAVYIVTCLWLPHGIKLCNYWEINLKKFNFSIVAKKKWPVNYMCEYVYYNWSARVGPWGIIN
jgi:hypothetical protein